MIVKILSNQKVRLGLAGVLLAFLGYGVGYFSKESKVITKTKIKKVIQFKESKKENRDVVIVVKKITKKDGTIVEESRTEDKTKIKSNIEQKIVSKIETENIAINDIGLSINVLTIAPSNDIDQRSYGLFVNKRVFSNIAIGALATTNNQVGLSVGINF